MLWLTLRQLKSGNEETRLNAVAEIGKLSAEQAADYLQPVLIDPSAQVRLAVVQTLGRFSEGCVVEPLLIALTDKSPDVRRSAVKALGAFSTEVTIKPLVAALRDGDASVRVIALNILESMQTIDSIQALHDNQWLVEEIRHQRALNQPQQTVESAEFERQQAAKQSFDFSLMAASPQTYVTYTIIGLNVAMFIVTVAAGAGLVDSNLEVMLKWGADYAPLTTHGEWWRLLTSAFLHFGIIHIAFNMWVLYRIGPTVERLYGSSFFLFIYLTTAISGSLTSIAVHGDKVVSAGASGAIFGVFGAWAAYLFVQKDSIPIDIRNRMLKSTLTLVGYNLVFGLLLSRTVDNSAHIGGVISGFLLGLIVARPLDLTLRKDQAKTRLSIGVAVAIFTIAASCIAIPKTAYNYRDEQAFYQQLRTFEDKEVKAVTEFNDLRRKNGDGTITSAQFADSVEADYLPVWREYNLKFTSIQLAENSPSYKMRDLLIQYTKSRGDATQALIDGYRTNDTTRLEMYTDMEKKTEDLIRQINALSKTK